MLNRFNKLSSYKFDEEGQCWSEIGSGVVDAGVEVDCLSVLSYNILFDKFDKHKIYSDARYPRILKFLENTKADVIALSEVTPKFLIDLLREDWVKKQYYVSESIAGTSINPYGQVLVSKYPFTLLSYQFSKQKKLIFGIFKMNGRLVFVPVVHLTSDKLRSNFVLQKRINQMNIIYKKIYLFESFKKLEKIVDVTKRAMSLEDEDFDREELEGWCDAFVVGDFNFGDHEEGEDLIVRPEFLDVWKHLHPSEGGFTFDPNLNPLAKINSRKNVGRRLDRIFVKTKNYQSYWEPISIKLFNDSSQFFKISENGEEIDLCLSDHFPVLAVFKFSTTPVFIQFPKPNPINPKINFEEQFNLKLISDPLFESEEGNDIRREVLQKLGNLISQILQNVVDRSEDSRAYQYALLPIGSYSLGIHSRNADIDCLAVSGISRNIFVKHLSQALQPLENAKFIKDVDDALIPVTKIIIDDVEMDILYICIPNFSDKSILNYNYSDYCEFVINQKLKLLHTPKVIEDEAGGSPNRGSIGTIRVADLLSKQAEFTDILSGKESMMNKQSAISLNGYFDTELIKIVVPDYSIFKIVVVAVHYWAKKKGLYSNKFGFLGGFCWNILVARICQLYPQASPELIFFKFFEIYSTWDWDNFPVMLLYQNLDQNYRQKFNFSEKMVILSLNKPYQNVARNVVKSTKKIIIQMMDQTRNEVSRGDFDSIWMDYDFFGSYNSYLKICVDALEKAEFIEWQAWVQSRLVDLLTRIENSSPYILIHPNPTAYKNKSTSYQWNSCFYFGLKVEAGQKLSIAMQIIEFTDFIKKWKKKTQGRLLFCEL
eukprot:TRINITY_DN8421_c0_g1_i2.p1 TRINITY_DN8421_c0_g1~~TRINITY_DN8421_c0_g1_i2.p1  ORF type:complete len:825 (-),score=204.08 TRINITY_DN8421_c0_g1_i2:500-2974(-)